MDSKRALLLGCGNNHTRKIRLTGQKEDFSDVDELIKLDMNPKCGADIVWNLEEHPLPFEDNYFDELHAYDVLEHVGRQGDWKGFLDEFAEYWRILKPGGTFQIIVPIGEDRFADIGHTRFFGINTFSFLSDCVTEERLAAGQQVTDYRWYRKYNFDIVFTHIADGNHHYGIVLVKA